VKLVFNEVKGAKVGSNATNPILVGAGLTNAFSGVAHHLTSLAAEIKKFSSQFLA
jgi:hypothetical protein